MELGKLNQLQVLQLENNTLTGSIPPSLGNCPSLYILLLGYNKLSGNIPMEFGKLASLQELGLEYNWALGGPIPRSISNCSQLQILFAGACNFSSIPIELWSMPNLQQVALFSNGLRGELPLEVGNCTNLSWLDLGWNRNQLNGSIPRTLGNLKQLSTLSLIQNNFTGEIPTTLGNLSNLVYLDLSKNNLNGSVLALSSLEGCTKLETLRFGDNQLVGQLDLNFTKFPSVQYFSAYSNSITGSYPTSFAITNSSLVLVDLSKNNITGVMPSQSIIGSHLQSLRVLDLAHNNLHGPIPSWIGDLKSLQVLDLSYNNLEGSIPSHVDGLAGFKGTNTSAQSTSGAFTLDQTVNLTKGQGISLTYPYILQTMTYFDLSSNNLVGGIPEALAQLVGLKYLILSNNNLAGEIPYDLGTNLTGLETLDLSNNNLNGTIPYSLALLQYLSSFNVSSNNLEGAIPTTAHFDTFDNTSYLPGNPGLCGSVINRSCNKGTPPSQGEWNVSTQGKFFEDEVSVTGFEIGVAMGFFSTVFMIVSWRPARSLILTSQSRKKVDPRNYGAFKVRS
jgi:Leucine-rich repeat (LRR) protein